MTNTLSSSRGKHFLAYPYFIHDLGSQQVPLFLGVISLTPRKKISGEYSITGAISLWSLLITRSREQTVKKEYLQDFRIIMIPAFPWKITATYFGHVNMDRIKHI